jgi:hypothetical protein
VTSSRGWAWGLLAVAALHALTTAGGWEITDHEEQLLVAERILTRGTLHLWDPGDKIPRYHGFIIGRTDGVHPVRSRFSPVTSLTLLPLLIVDRWIGWGEAGQFGRLVHLQGHIFVLMGLAILGAALRKSGVSSQGTAIAVVLTGLSWPVWMVSRRVGPESILVFLVCVFLSASLLESQNPRRWLTVQGLVCLALPWVHPTGPFISAALVLTALWDHAPFQPVRSTWAVWTGAFLGLSSFILIWNTFYEGDWLRGGYGRFLVEYQSPLAGLPDCLASLALGAPVLLSSALYAWIKKPGKGPGRHAALVVTGILLLLLSPFAKHEASRRLAAVLPGWGILLGTTWDRLRVAPLTAQALAALCIVPSVSGLLEFGDFYYTSRGIFVFPWILWLRLLNGGTPWGFVLVAVLLILILLAWGWMRLFDVLRVPPGLARDPDAERP